MPKKISTKEPRVERHKNGSVRAKGEMLEGRLHGYWEWFRADGSKMRSGFFERGQQVGEWNTYDRNGRLVKTTRM